MLFVKMSLKANVIYKFDPLKYNIVVRFKFTWYAWSCLSIRLKRNWCYGTEQNSLMIIILYMCKNMLQEVSA